MQLVLSQGKPFVGPMLAVASLRAEAGASSMGASFLVCAEVGVQTAKEADNKRTSFRGGDIKGEGN